MRWDPEEEANCLAAIGTAHNASLPQFLLKAFNNFLDEGMEDYLPFCIEIDEPFIECLRKLRQPELLRLGELMQIGLKGGNMHERLEDLIEQFKSEVDEQRLRKWHSSLRQVYFESLVKKKRISIMRSENAQKRPRDPTSKKFVSQNAATLPLPQETIPEEIDFDHWFEEFLQDDDPNADFSFRDVNRSSN